MGDVRLQGFLSESPDSNFSTVLPHWWNENMIQSAETLCLQISLQDQPLLRVFTQHALVIKWLCISEFDVEVWCIHVLFTKTVLKSAIFVDPVFTAFMFDNDLYSLLSLQTSWLMNVTQSGSWTVMFCRQTFTSACESTTRKDSD